MTSAIAIVLSSNAAGSASNPYAQPKDRENLQIPWSPRGSSQPHQDGKIEAEVKLTGILSMGGLLPGESRKYGTTIAPGLYAPVHQHFFIARMDMAIDSKPGEALHQVVKMNVKVEKPGNENVHDNAFYAEETLLKSELQIMRDCYPLSARHWIGMEDYCRCLYRNRARY